MVVSYPRQSDEGQAMQLKLSISAVAAAGKGVQAQEVQEVVARACPVDVYRQKKVLLIVPDGTRTAPVGMLFRALYRQIGVVTKALDVMIALGTHQPMSEAAICERLGIDSDSRKETYGKVRFFNHEWNNPAALQKIGTISSDEIRDLTEGLFAMEVPVEINKKIFEYD